MFVFGWRNCCFTSRFHDAFLIATSWVWKVQFPKIIPSLVLNMKSPSLKTNIAPENRHPLVFQPSIFRCYVSFRECRNMSDSFHPPRQPWKMSGFQITLCRTQLDFDAHFALKGCFHTFSRRWAVAKYFPQRPKGNRNLVPWINAIWWPRSPRGYVCEFERRVKWRCATFSYGSIVGWPTGKLIWCLLHYPKKNMFGRFFATGARNPSRISRLMETTKLPLRLSNDFLGIAEDFEMWWGLQVLPFLWERPYTSMFAESNAMNRPKRHLFRQVHAPKNRSWSGLESFLDIISCTCKYFRNTVQVWRGRMQMLGHVTLFPARWNLAPFSNFISFFSSMQEGLPLTPLHLAAWNGHATAAQALLNAGASIDFLQEARALWCVEGWGFTGWRTCQHWNSDRWKASSRWKQPQRAQRF